MSYLVLARKYRPGSFSAVSGQEHVTRTLSNAIQRDRIAHAYLFAGPRGVGKTSIARIFSKCLECEKGPTVEPCLECRNCKEIAQGTSLAVWEIDGASHNSVDNVRDLIDSFRALPPPGARYKIYIIDEVHMLSMAAFNALLKSLEEPPPHTVFILATTEAHKIPDTVISRCQRHDFRALGPKQIIARLREISKEEKFAVEDEALRMIARLSDGSMRDSQSLLDRVRSFCDDKITAREVGEVLGTVDRSVLLDLSRAILARDSEAVLRISQKAFSTGLDPALFLKEFVTHWREIFLAKFGDSELLEGIGLTSEEIEELRGLVADTERRDLQDLLHLAREGADSALRSSFPQYAFEALVVRLALREPVKEIGAILAKMKSSLSTGRQEERPQRSAPPPALERVVEAKGTPSPIRKKSREVSAPAIDGSTALKSDPVVAERSSLVWEEFVEFAKNSTSPMLVEHLRRLHVQRFIPGMLEGRGPEMCIRSLTTPENKLKLTEILMKYSGAERWQITLQNGEKRHPAEPGSIVHAEEAKKREERESRAKELLEHPTVKSLKKAFPGSVVEGVKFKE